MKEPGLRTKDNEKQTNKRTKWIFYQVFANKLKSKSNRRIIDATTNKWINKCGKLNNNNNPTFDGAYLTVLSPSPLVSLSNRCLGKGFITISANISSVATYFKTIAPFYTLHEQSDIVCRYAWTWPDQQGPLPLQ